MPYGRETWTTLVWHYQNLPLNIFTSPFKQKKNNFIQNGELNVAFSPGCNHFNVTFALDLVTVVLIIFGTDYDRLLLPQHSNPRDSHSSTDFFSS